MKVQELLPNSRPSPASRAGRLVGPHAKPFDFAGALTEARSRKPEAKPTETEAPAAKKTAAASKKDKLAKDAAPANDAAVTDDSIATDEAHASVPTEESEPVAEADESSEDGEAEAEAEPALNEVDADPSAMAMAQGVAPQAPIAPEDSDTGDEVEAAEGEEPRHAPAQAPDGDSELAAIPLDDELAELDRGDKIPLALDDGHAEVDSELTAQAPAKQPAAPAAPADNGDQPQSGSTAKDGKEKQQLTTAAGEFALAADAAAEPMGSAPVASGASDATTNAPTTPTALPLHADAAKGQAAPAAPPAPAPLPPPPHFAEANHPKIVTAVQGQMLANGGSMQIRLDPPELGALQVMVNMKDGVMTASFVTSNDDATRLLSHSLSQLKHVLESQGVSVEKLQVQQSPKDQQAQNDDPRDQPRNPQDDAHRQEQQRKEMLRRMWRRLANGSDPLDLVA